jgi:tetratricopeptide (TPR) repeat protein
MDRSAASVERFASRVPWLLAAAVVLCYANSLAIPFHFDDWHVIEENPYIRSLDNVPRFFVDPSTFSVNPRSRLLRPVLLTTFAVNYAVSGLAPWSYHLLAIALHWIVAILIYRIVRDHLWLGEARYAVATAAALLVAVHPLNTEPVVYVSARSATLVTALYLGAFDAALRRRRWTCRALFVLALLTKPIAVTLPLALVGYWGVARARTGAGESPRPMPWRFVTELGAVGVLVGLVYPAALVSPTIRADMSSTDTWTYVMTGWSAYLYYLRLFLWPDALVADRVDYPLARSFLTPQAWMSLVALLGLGGLAWRARRRWPALTFAGLWFFVTLAPESSVFPLAEPVNEHRPYLAMLGFGTAAALGLGALARRLAAVYHAPLSWTFALVVAVVTSVLGAATVGRNRTWQSEYALWSDAVAKAPGNSRAWLNLGHAAMSLDRSEEARAHFLRAHAIDRCYAIVQMNLCSLDVRAGNLDTALAWADDAVACEPGLALSHFYRATVLERLRRFDDARAAYEETTRRDPLHAEAWHSIGRLSEAREAWTAAAAAHDAALTASDGTHTEAAMHAGLLYHYRLGRLAEAVAHYRAVLRTVPTHYGAQYQLAVALFTRGERHESAAVWRGFETRAVALGDDASLASAPAGLRVVAYGEAAPGAH